MCGIAGFIDRSIPEAEARGRLDSMLARIAHRGPDGSGLHVAAGLALGMRRLSIIDLEGGAQPIWNEDRTIGVVFNGEIYNYLELADELAGNGHVFRTHSDTEVLVHLYEERGEAMLERLRGMFAFAILDQKRGALFVARDHFGQKPLYYAQHDGRFAFASELKCLFALAWTDRERDPDAFLDYAVWLSLPAPRTHFRHIHKLPAGSCITIPLENAGAAAPRKYWNYDLRQIPDLVELDSAADALDETLRDSVRKHLRADVPVGVLLSSGLDSRVVTAYAQEIQEGRMQTFTVGFGADDSELRGAAETAREIHSQHHSIELTAEDFAADLQRVAWHLDEPIGDPAAFAVLRVCELARQHVKVLLSGEGSDELFAGYESRYLGMCATLRRSDKLRALRLFLPAAGTDPAPSRWQRLCARAHHTRGGEAVALRMEGLPGDVRTPRGLTPAQRGTLGERCAELAAAVYRPQRDTLSELLTLDLDWQLAESLLQKADKMSMAASIELRTPILDLEVARVAARIPSALKLPRGGPGKLVLRRCLARRLAEPLNRPKKGFPVPLASWFRGPLREPLEAALFRESSAVLQHLDRKLLRSAWDDFLRGSWDGERALYALWLYDIWDRTLPVQGGV